MKRTRLLSVLLALALLCACLPMAVSAQSDREFLGTATIERRVNPLYEGLIDESEIPSGSITAPTLDADQLYATTYVTMDKAAQQVRDAMAARKATFEIHVKDKSSDYNEVFNRLFVTAFEHTGVPTEGDYLQWHYAGYSASLSYGTEGDYYIYSYTIEMAYYTTAAQEKEMDTAVKNLLKNLNVGSKSDYQKVCAVYDYICDNITYDYDNLEDDSYTLKFSAYAALVNKTAVCQGYAQLFYRLMLELDVDARLIAGDGGGPHAWNIVKLGNVYYNLDSTWDAGYNDYYYFLLNSENFSDHARYLDYMTTQFHTDYPMSATDYVDGVEGEPEYFFVVGGCGDNAYFGVNRDRELVIAGEGATYGSWEVEEMGIVIWDYWVDGFDTVIVDEGITVLGEYGFENMDNITSVTFPDSLTRIEDYVFYECDSIQKIVCPDNLVYIGRSAFSDCDELKDVILNEGLTEIFVEAFRFCNGLTSIRIPDSVTDMYGHAFGDCANLKSVTLGKSMEEISGYTFANCTGLTEIEFSDALKSISTAAFSNCTSLMDIELPDGLEYIGPAAFEDCKSLAEITFPASVIQVDGFSGCTGLKKITFLGEAPMISADAFEDVVATVYYPGDLDSWTEDVLVDCGGDLTWVSTHTHSYTSSVVAPTCTAQGYTTYTCECGDSYKDNYVAALGHDYANSVVTAPTCTAQGYTTYTCSVCGHSYKDNYVDMVDHEFGEYEFDKATKSHVSECAVCGEKISDSCTFDAGTLVREATMEKFGIIEYTCTVCGGSYESETVYRVFGAGRSETAIAAAEELKAVLGVEKFDSIILAGGEGFADALAGSYLAVQKDAPILLVRASTIELNKNYVLDNLTEGGTVYILGGPAAVPQEMEDALAGLNVVRLQGDDRFLTNLKILEEAGIDDEEILICTGWNFADSLSASATGLPILMLNTSKNELTAEQEAFLEKYADNEFTIIGGTAAVSEKLEADVEAIVGAADRVSGNTREETSVKVAKRYFSVPDYAVVAYSRNFPDGLCGGPLAHALKSPLLLVNTKQETPAAEYIASQGITQGFVLGGTAAVSEDSARIVFDLK